MPNPWWPTRLHVVIAVWLVPHYTAWWQNLCILQRTCQDGPRFILWSVVAEDELQTCTTYLQNLLTPPNPIWQVRSSSAHLFSKPAATSTFASQAFFGVCPNCLERTQTWPVKWTWSVQTSVAENMLGWTHWWSILVKSQRPRPNENWKALAHLFSAELSITLLHLIFRYCCLISDKWGCSHVTLYHD